MTMKLRIPQATKRGYVEVEPYGAFDWNYPSSLTRRGRVQGEGGGDKSYDMLPKRDICL